MHELSIAGTLLDDLVKKSRGKKPVKVLITVGAASGIDADFLKHSFTEHIFPEKNWDGVELIFENEEPALSCSACGEKIIDPDVLACPSCKGEELEILSGSRVYVKEVLTEEE